jgi:vacuolar-type H+-ATPase subunit I/STV1
MIDKEEHKNEQNSGGVVFQALLGIAVWMSFGLLLEGFLGFRVPSYMSVSVRRELLQLAHTHGTLLNLILLAVAICAKCELVFPRKFAIVALRIGSILMPLGFLFGGIWLIKDEPNLSIFLAPLGGLLMIFGIVSVLFSLKKEKLDQ